MKILPNYLIEYMPILEEAMEELRLSVIDRAYDLLKCLDIDELSTDDIRNKLELYDLKVDNMTEAWLPNGRFYRMYPEIKHNRTRLNAVKSIAQSGGQFEGVWSTGFSNKSEYAFSSIQIMRHYYLGSASDGYLYVSGNSSVATGISGSTAVQALQTDILMNQALPAGYTYLYIPWPRPNYPTESGYFYNIHMLDFDRLYSSSDKDDDIPASTYYHWDTGEGTPYHTPYWFDYHQDGLGNTTVESGTYLDINKEIVDVDRIKEDAVYYQLDDSCKFLNDEDGKFAVFPTNFYVYSRNNTTVPDRSQTFSLLSDEDNIATIDENYFIVDPSLDDVTLPGPYRFDYVNPSKHMMIRYDMNGIKSYRPTWNESSPIFSMLQSDYNDDLKPTSVAPKNSLFNWFKFKENSIQPKLNDSTISRNEPPISEVAHTDCGRPTAQYLHEKQCCCYFRQDGNDIVFNNGNYYKLFCLGEVNDGNNYNNYDPLKFYQVSYLGYIDDNDNSLRLKDLSNSGTYLIGDPYDNSLYYNLNNNGYVKENIKEASYIVYREKDRNRVWTSQTKENTRTTKVYTTLYNEVASDEIYYLSSSRDLDFEILAAYESNGNKVDVSGYSLCLYTADDRYYLALKKPASFSASNVNLNGVWEFTTYSNIKSVSSTFADSYFGFGYIDATSSVKDAILSLSDDYVIFNNLRDGNALLTHGFSKSNAMSIDISLDSETVIQLKFMNSSESLFDGLSIYDELNESVVTVLGFETASNLNNSQYPDYSTYKNKDWYNKREDRDTVWFDVSFSLKPGNHTLWFIYGKDTSVSRLCDCSYIAIPKIYLTDLVKPVDPVDVACIDYAVKSVKQTAAISRNPKAIPIYHQQMGIETTASYYPDDKIISFPYFYNSNVIKEDCSFDDFYEDGWIVKKDSTRQFVGNSEIEVWHDDKNIETL